MVFPCGGSLGVADCVTEPMAVRTGVVGPAYDVAQSENPFTISGRRGEHSGEAKSRAKRRGALAWSMVLRAM